MIDLNLAHVKNCIRPNGADPRREAYEEGVCVGLVLAFIAVFVTSVLIRIIG